MAASTVTVARGCQWRGCVVWVWVTGAVDGCGCVDRCRSRGGQRAKQPYTNPCHHPGTPSAIRHGATTVPEKQGTAVQSRTHGWFPTLHHTPQVSTARRTTGGDSSSSRRSRCIPQSITFVYDLVSSYTIYHLRIRSIIFVYDLVSSDTI